MNFFVGYLKVSDFEIYVMTTIQLMEIYGYDTPYVVLMI